MSQISWLNDSQGFFYPDVRHSSIRPASTILLDSYCTAGLKQVNGIPNSRGRRLDLCFVSEELGLNCTVSEAPAPLVKDIRYHPPLLVTMQINIEKYFRDVNENVAYDFGKGDFDGMNLFLTGVDWEVILSDSDANLAASTLSAVLLYAIDQFVPRKRFQHPPKPAWSNSQLRHLKRVKRSALRKHSKYRTDLTKAAYFQANNEYKELNDRLYNAHINLLQSQLKSNPKSFWRHVSDQRKESGLPSSMTNGVMDADSIPEIADLFRSQFSSVFNNESLSAQDIDIAANNVPLSTTSGQQLSVTSDMVITAGKQLKSSTGCGPDGVPSLILKRCLDPLAMPLARVFNLSLMTGVFPACWKDSFVFPVHKKGCKRTVSNYRGIAALSATSKLFEKIVLETLFHSHSHCISPEQHGFMPKRSTTSNLASFTSFLITEMEKGNQIDAIYTDLSAAFDKMNHEIALAKFDRIGIHNSLLTWLRSYLIGRNMSVKIGDYVSSPFPATSGVPQGSHLGPFLFLLYMNDVNLSLSCLKLSYADDLKLYFVIRKPADALYLQQQLEVFGLWCHVNRMSLNVAKCSVISFGRKRSLYQHNYSLSGTVLKRETTVKDLGVLLDVKLSFKDHISYIVSKASSQLGFIFRFSKNFRDVYCLKALYCSLVRPILEYSAVIWSPHYQNAKSRIEAVQKRFVRFALRRLPWQDPIRLPSYADRSKLIKLESLTARRDVAKACFVADLLQSHIDCPALLGLLDINLRSRVLRSHVFLYNRRSRTNYGQNETIRSMCRVFNRCYSVFDFNVSRNCNKNSFKRILC